MKRIIAILPILLLCVGLWGQNNTLPWTKFRKADTSNVTGFQTLQNNLIFSDTAGIWRYVDASSFLTDSLNIGNDTNLFTDDLTGIADREHDMNSVRLRFINNDAAIIGFAVEGSENLMQLNNSQFVLANNPLQTNGPVYTVVRGNNTFVEVRAETSLSNFTEFEVATNYMAFQQYDGAYKFGSAVTVDYQPPYVTEIGENYLMVYDSTTGFWKSMHPDTLLSSVTVGGGSTDYVSNVTFSSPNLTFTGVGNAFNSTVDISGINTDAQTLSIDSSGATYPKQYQLSISNGNTVTFTDTGGDLLPLAVADQNLEDNRLINMGGFSLTLVDASPSFDIRDNNSDPSAATARIRFYDQTPTQMGSVGYSATNELFITNSVNGGDINFETNAGNIISLDPHEFQSTIIDGAGLVGTNGQVLSSTGSGVLWVDATGGGFNDFDITDGVTTTTITDGNTITFAAGGINTVDVTGTTVTYTATEVDGSTTNELQTLSIDSSGAAYPKRYDITLSDGGGTISLFDTQGSGFSGFDISDGTTTTTITSGEEIRYLGTGGITTTVAEAIPNTVTIDGSVFQQGTESYVSNVVLDGTDLIFTGIGSAFNSTVDLSSLSGGNNIYNTSDALTSARVVNLNSFPLTFADASADVNIQDNNGGLQESRLVFQNSTPTDVGYIGYNASSNMNIENTIGSLFLDVSGIIVSADNHQFNTAILDKDAQSGTAGQILSSTGTQVDWIDAPTGGGGGVNIYNADSTLAGNRVVTMNGNSLTFLDNSPFLTLKDGNGTNNTVSGGILITGSDDQVEGRFDLTGTGQMRFINDGGSGMYFQTATAGQIFEFMNANGSSKVLVDGTGLTDAAIELSGNQVWRATSEGGTTDLEIAKVNAGAGRVVFTGDAAEHFIVDINGTQITSEDAHRFNSTILDNDGDAGTSGQILSSTATGVNWIDPPSGGGFTSFDISDGTPTTATISDGEEIRFLGGNGISTVVADATPNTVTISPVIDPVGGNLLTVSASGLAVADQGWMTGWSVGDGTTTLAVTEAEEVRFVDQNSINFVVSNPGSFKQVTAGVIVDPDVNNILSVTANGLLVDGSAIGGGTMSSFDITDGANTRTVDDGETIQFNSANGIAFTVGGATPNTVTPTIIIDDAVDNILTNGVDGLYVPDPGIVNTNIYTTDGTLAGARTVTMGANTLEFTGTGNVIMSSDLDIDGTILDVNDEVGGAGQILSSTGTGVDWIDAPTGGGDNLFTTNLTLTENRTHNVGGFNFNFTNGGFYNLGGVNTGDNIAMTSSYGRIEQEDANGNTARVEVNTGTLGDPYVTIGAFNPSGSLIRVYNDEIEFSGKNGDYLFASTYEPPAAGGSYDLLGYDANGYWVTVPATQGANSGVDMSAGSLQITDDNGTVQTSLISTDGGNDLTAGSDGKLLVTGASNTNFFTTDLVLNATRQHSLNGNSFEMIANTSVNGFRIEGTATQGLFETKDNGFTLRSAGTSTNSIVSSTSTLTLQSTDGATNTSSITISQGDIILTQTSGEYYLNPANSPPTANGGGDEDFLMWDVTSGRLERYALSNIDQSTTNELVTGVSMVSGSMRVTDAGGNNDVSLISTDASNTITVGSDGKLYSAAGSGESTTVTDGNTIDLTLTGSDITGEVILDPSGDNALSSSASGLLMDETALTITESQISDLTHTTDTYLGSTDQTLAANRIIDMNGFTFTIEDVDPYLNLNDQDGTSGTLATQLRHQYNGTDASRIGFAGSSTLLVENKIPGGDLWLAATSAGTIVSRDEHQFIEQLLDKDGDAGTSGQILSSTGTQINWIDAPSGGASQLSDLSDVNTSTPTNRNVLVADGVDFESRALVEADISDLTHTTDTYLGNTDQTLTADRIIDGGTANELIYQAGTPRLILNDDDATSPNSNARLVFRSSGSDIGYLGYSGNSQLNLGVIGTSQSILINAGSSSGNITLNTGSVGRIYMNDLVELQHDLRDINDEEGTAGQVLSSLGGTGAGVDWIDVPNLANADQTLTANRIIDGGTDFTLTYQSSLPELILKDDDSSSGSARIFFQNNADITRGQLSMAGANMTLQAPGGLLNLEGQQGLNLGSLVGNIVSEENHRFNADILDVNSESGTAGQILSSLGSGNGVDWIDAPSGGTPLANADQTLTGNRVIDLSIYSLAIEGAASYLQLRDNNSASGSIASQLRFSDQSGTTNGSIGFNGSSELTINNAISTGDIRISSGTSGKIILGGGDVEIDNDLIDVNNETGTAGQILSSLGSGNGVDWIDVPAGGTPLATADQTLTGNRIIDGVTGFDLTYQASSPKFIIKDDDTSTPTSLFVFQNNIGARHSEISTDINGFNIKAVTSSVPLNLDANGANIIALADFEFDADIVDINGSEGTAGQILSSLGTGNGVDWIDAPTGGTPLATANQTLTGNRIIDKASFSLTIQDADASLYLKDDNSATGSITGRIYWTDQADGNVGYVGYNGTSGLDLVNLASNGNTTVGSTSGDVILSATSGQITANQDVELNGDLIDINNESGTAGQILTSLGTGNGVDWVDNGKHYQIFVTEPGTDITIGDGQAYIYIPSQFNGKIVAGVQAALVTASSVEVVELQLYNVTQAVDILSTTLTIDANEFTSLTAATPAVINTSNRGLTSGDRIRVDIDKAGTGAQGLIIDIYLTD